MFCAGHGRLIDEEGIDWWDLTVADGSCRMPCSLLILKSIASKMSPADDLWTTRRGVQIRMLESFASSSIPAFGGTRLVRTSAQVMHYAGLLSKFSGSPD